MKVFHGSDTFIKEVDLSKCQPGRDFGQGFYVTKFYRQAQSMAAKVSKWHKKKTPIITEFDFDEFAFIFDELNTLRFDAYNEAWLDFVILCRQNKSYEKSHDYDIVEGPVADDAVTIRIDDYLQGKVGKADFLGELAFKRPTHQICFCTFQSLLMLTRTNYRAENDIFHIDDLVVQQLVLDFELPEAEASDLYFYSTAYRRLTDESSGLHQKPWTEVYKLLLQELKLKG
ncbi:MAG: DUF3990 domain-containing protein [Prevotellaceae bacterium]|jgi:hypothetical protein|nr:DUF3990 domain-containing protein [Prevotellaceae bacterium]